jgi:hypothetical protein
MLQMMHFKFRSRFESPVGDSLRGGALSSFAWSPTAAHQRLQARAPCIPCELSPATQVPMTVELDAHHESG